MKLSGDPPIKKAHKQHSLKGLYSKPRAKLPQSKFHEQFRSSNDFFHQLVESLEDYAVLTTDTLGTISSWNSGAQKMFGYQEAEIIGKHSSILLPPKERKQGVAEKQLITSLKEGRAHTEQWLVKKNKSLFWTSTLIFPLYDSEKNVQGFTKIVRDLTERKLLADQEKRFRTIIEKSTDGIRLIDKQGKILYASPSTKRILGYSYEEYINNHILDLIHPDDRARYKKSIRDILKNPGKSVEATYRIKHKDGQYRWMEGIGTNLLNDSTVQAIVSNFRDITERKRAEEEKEKVVQQFTAVLDQLPAGVIIAEAKTGKFTLVNKQVRKILKVKSIHINSYKDYKNLSRYSMNGKEYSPNDWPISRSMLKGETIKNEELQIKKGDGTMGVISESSAPIIEKNGSIESGVATFIDITEQKNLERRKDEFVSIAGHELKTPLTSLNLFTEMLRQSIKANNYDTAALFASRIKQQSIKLTELVNDLLDVSRIETGKLRFRLEVFDVSELLHDIVEDMQYTTTKHTIKCTSKKEIFVHADRYRIYQVLTNLLTNAIKYSPESTIIKISAKIKSEFVQISVIDQGIGITKQQQKRIFDKLYQVEESKDKTFLGLGMGLYICKEIITRHGGTIWVRSDKDSTKKTAKKGSTFSFTLPLKK